MPEGRPVLMTVDDDPCPCPAPSPATCAGGTASTTGSSARRTRPQALDALREVKLRGDPVAAILADYRMPQHERHRVPRAGHGPLPPRPPRAAHRVRRHRRRDRRDQRRRRRPLPAQAVGPAGGEALPGGRRAARDVAGAGRRTPILDVQVVGHRVVGALARGARLPGPQLRPLPLVDRRRRRGPPAARGRRGVDAGRDPAGRDARTGRR